MEPKPSTPHMTVPANIATRLEDTLRRYMCSHEALLELLALDASEHLDTDAMAAFVDGNADLKTAGHLLRCADCRERTSSVAALANVDPLTSPATGHRTNFVRRMMHSQLPSAFATLHVQGSGCWIESKTGSSQRKAVLQVRGPASEAIIIRDAIDDASFETRILLSSDQQRFDLHVRWLDAACMPDAIRVEQAAKIVVSAPLRDCVAVVPSLRARDSTLWFEQKSMPLGHLTLFVENVDA